jgi:hypothetical protein
MIDIMVINAQISLDNIVLKCFETHISLSEMLESYSIKIGEKIILNMKILLNLYLLNEIYVYLTDL